MSAFENVKTMSAADIIAKVAAEGLLEFGVDRTPVADKWNLVNEERFLQSNPIRVVAGLNNSDRDFALLALLKENPEKIFEAMAIAKIAVDAEQMYLYLPETEAAYAEKIADKAAAAGIEVKTGIVNVRESRGGAFHHFETLAAIADIFEGSYEPGTYMAVCQNGETGELKKIAYGTKVADIVGNVDAKAIAIGTRLYDLSVLETAIEKDTQIGNGVITVYSPACCMIHEAEEVLAAERRHSCGKCTFCREGLIQLHTMMKEITLGQGKKEYTDMMDEIGTAMVFSTPCTMGQTASDFVLGTLKYFPSEYEDHIKKRKCENNVCSAFMSIYIDPNKCTGCEVCADVCPKSAIDGKPGFVHIIDEFECDKCGKCIEACEENAIVLTSGRVPKLPSRPVKAKNAKAGKGREDGESSEREDRRERRERRDRRERRERHASRRSARAHAAEQTEAAMETAAAQPVKAVETQPVKAAAAVTERTVRRGNGTMKKMETDVIIVAGGPAGLAASITVGENNLKSIVFEKSNTTGGAANMGMGPLGIGTKYQKNAFNDITVEQALKMHMEYTHFRVDSDLVQTYFNKSADTIQWLEDMGVEFAGAFRYFRESEATWHIVKPENGVIGPRAAGPMVRIMTERAKELGAEIYLETPVEDLIMEDGKCVGVRAFTKDGEEIEARAKAVVVATGGFGTNAQMIKENFGYNLWEDYFPFNVPGTTGDGLNMMWKAGAEKFGANIEMIYQLKDNMNYFLLDAVLRQPNLLINQKGDRFMDEGKMGNTTFTGNAINLQPGHYAYCIMDGAILNHYKKNGPDIFDIVHPEEAFIAVDPEFDRAEAEGYDGFFRAKTIDELAEKLGIDPDKLEETIDEYNEMCESGYDSKFHKKHEFLHEITGKGGYLAGRFYIAAYGTVGGVRVNKYCEVMDADQNPIPGLYSAGSDANTIYGDSYNFTLCGNTMGFAVNSGRMAGEAIAEYIAELDN